MRRSPKDMAIEVLRQAIFEAAENAMDLAVRKSPANQAARLRRLEQIGKAGADIQALIGAMKIVDGPGKPRRQKSRTH